MQGKWQFLLLLLFKHKKSHASVFFLASLLIALIFSVLFISTSIQFQLKQNLQNEADITISKFVGGKKSNTPKTWIDESLDIQGVKNAYGRVYGEYYFESKGIHFFIVGIDLFDQQNLAYIKKLLPKFNQEEFLSKNYMIIGSGVKKFFDELRYINSYIFRPPDRGKQKLYIYGSFPKDTNLVSSDLIVMDIHLAKKILGIDEDKVSDIAIELYNQDEMQTIYYKLLIQHFDSQIITKKEREIYVENVFNYKGGVFLTLYLIVIASFTLLLYQRYSYVNKVDRKEVAVLRFIAWNISELLWLKLLENAIVAIWAYLSGFILAYIYVFYMDAPFLRDIFLGNDNLYNASSFTPAFDFSSLALVFFFFIVPFLLAILIPLWKLCITPISEISK